MNWHAWNACMAARSSRVRIPVSPPNLSNNADALFFNYFILCSCYNNAMQPNPNWQPEQNTGLENNQTANDYSGQTLQQIEDSVRSNNPRETEALEDRRVPNVTINPLVNGASNTQSEADQPLPDYEVTWEAQEYITPEKNTAWYVGLGVVVVVVILLDIFILKSITVSVLIITIAAVLIAMTVRPARMIQYRMNKDGIYIDEQLVKFSDYKAFGLFKEHDNNSILLIPVKRFLPGLSIYFPEDQGEAIVDLLARRLPNQEVKQDFMDKIVRLLRL